MRNAAVVPALLSVLALTACNPTAGLRADSNLNCAALIGAATVLIRNGKVEKDPALMKRALVSSMSHLNAYAIPKGLKQAEAFAEVKALRRTFVETRPADEILNRAKRCAARTPA